MPRLAGYRVLLQIGKIQELKRRNLVERWRCGSAICCDGEPLCRPSDYMFNVRMYVCFMYVEFRNAVTKIIQVNSRPTDLDNKIIINKR